jgi:hypothetical protein
VLVTLTEDEFVVSVATYGQSRQLPGYSVLSCQHSTWSRERNSDYLLLEVHAVDRETNSYCYKGFNTIIR